MSYCLYAFLCHSSTRYCSSDRWLVFPPCIIWGYNNPCGSIEQRSNPRKVPTSSEFGTPTGVLHCSMSPQLFVCATLCRGRVPKDTNRQGTLVLLQCTDLFSVINKSSMQPNRDAFRSRTQSSFKPNVPPLGSRLTTPRSTVCATAFAVTWRLL